MARPSKNILSPSIIAEAALTMVERDHDFTIPGIAKELGVNPSSLYHHVRNDDAWYVAHAQGVFEPAQS